MDLEKIVVFSGNIVAFGHLGDVLDDGDEGPGDVAVHLLQLDGAENDEAQVQFLRVQDGDVLANEAAALQPLEAFEDRGGGQVHPGGQFLGRQAGVLLQQAQDVQVGGVEENVVHGGEYFSYF